VVAGAAAGELNPGELSATRELFRRQLLNILAYWQRQVAEHTGDLAALDHELANLARAVEFGWQTRAAYPEVLHLLVVAHDVILRRGSALFGNELLGVMAAEAHRAASLDESLAVLDLAAQLYGRRGLTHEAERCYRDSLALATAEAAGDQAPHAARVQVELGRFLVEHERVAEGLALLEAALAAAEAAGDALTQARALVTLGWHYHYQVSDGRAAEQVLLRALPLLEQLDDVNMLVRVWLDLANAHWRLGDVARAEADCARAQSYLPASGNLRLQAMVEGLRGILSCARGDYAASLDHLARAEVIYRELGEGRELANVYQNLGVSYWWLKDWARAIEHSRRALQLWRALEQVGREAETLYNIAETYLAMGDPDAARAALDEVRACVARRRERLGATPWGEQMLKGVAELEQQLLPPGESTDAHR
jgi:tetratricopeptide (TPR) repeat protein